MRVAARRTVVGCLAAAALASIAPGCSGGGRPATPAASAPQGYAIRGIYGRDSSPTGFRQTARLGFDFVDSGPYSDRMRQLAAHGLKGFVWLGGYSNSACRFNESDGWIRSHVGAIAHAPGVGAYFIDDEPDASKCPDAPAQIRARARLVKSIDPRPPTFIVTYHVDQLKLFAGAVDVIGLDHYPCSHRYGCRYSLIDQQAAEADRLGIRYWGVIQAYGDSYYALPTPQELHREFERWRTTHMQGYLVFGWRWPPDRPSLWLLRHRDLQVQLAVENARAAARGP